MRPVRTNLWSWTEEVRWWSHQGGSSSTLTLPPVFKPGILIMKWASAYLPLYCYYIVYYNKALWLQMNNEWDMWYGGGRSIGFLCPPNQVIYILAIILSFIKRIHAPPILRCLFFSLLNCLLLWKLKGKEVKKWQTLIVLFHNFITISSVSRQVVFSTIWWGVIVWKLNNRKIK